MKLLPPLCLCAVILGLETASVAAEELRTALVIGVADSGSRKTLPPLPGVGKDIAAISAKLRELGFEVTTVTNPTLARAEQAVNDFGTRLRARHGVGLYYFSGYGAEFEGTNYLLPKAAHISKSRDLRSQALSATSILRRMAESGAAVNLVFLDCRQGVLTNDGAGFAPMQVDGAFVGFATARRRMAETSSEGSLYTRALVDHLATPGLDITDLHTLVTADVCSRTATQTPGQYSGLSSRFCFRPMIDSGSNVAPYWTYDSNVARWLYRDPAAEGERLSACPYLEIPSGTFRDLSGFSLALNLFSRQSRRNGHEFDGVSKNSNYTIGGHGSSDYIQDDRGQKKDGAGRKLYPKDLAEEIRSDPNYLLGSPVTLYACNTGRGANSFAQKLADELGVPVMAPDDVLWANSQGPSFVGPWKGKDRTKKDYSHRHGFKYFLPRP